MSLENDLKKVYDDCNKKESTLFCSDCGNRIDKWEDFVTFKEKDLCISCYSKLKFSEPELPFLSFKESENVK